MTAFRTGEVIWRPKGLVRHRGVVVGDGWVLHNTPGRGEHVSTLAEFAAGRTVRRERTPPAPDPVALARARVERSGRRYHLLYNNCEHTVSRVTEGRSRSPQLLGWVAGVVAGAVALVVTRRPGLAVTGFTAVNAAVQRGLSRR